MKNHVNLGISTLKIKVKDVLGSGIFLKTERNNKPFYFIMTNQHVISEEMIDKKETIELKYVNENKPIKIDLNIKERIILGFEKSLDIDVVIIEVIPKDKIDEIYFLKPNTNYEGQYLNLIGKKIQIMQYPQGKELALSEGKILEIDNENECHFYHNLETEEGSSGSPIVLEGEDLILGIHKGHLERNKKIKMGIFIKLIIDIIKEYKRQGEGIEYYENGEIKYEGNFVNDEYDGEGKLYHKNGFIYIGQFKNGKKSGFGCIYKDNNFIQGKFENDKLIESYNNEINHQNNSNNFNFENNNLNSDNNGNDDINDNNQININNNYSKINNYNINNNYSQTNNYTQNNNYAQNNNYSQTNNYTTYNFQNNHHNEHLDKNDIDDFLKNAMKIKNKNYINNIDDDNNSDNFEDEAYRNVKKEDDCIII